MKCKCRNNSRFPQFTVGKTYTFQYEDKYKTRVVVLSDENEEFSRPEWLGEEVTGDKMYYNSMLMKNPYKNWK